MELRYGLVLGQGRSGTNWVLDVLDASPRTFCRNEPDLCVPSFMDPLPNNWRIGADGARLAKWWDAVAEQTATHMGEMDHRLDHPKDFVLPISQRLGIAQLSARPRIRRLASRVLWSWADGEWKMPRWVGSLDGVDSVALFKLVQGYNWATWVLDNRPHVPVVQVVRHPGGRHESFLRRYIDRADPQEALREKIDQLRLLAGDAAFAERMGPVDELTLEEAETWFGVYQMELIEHRAANLTQYLRLRYEDLVTEPEATIAQLYNHFGLALTDDVRNRIETAKNRSVFGAVNNDTDERANGWRERLDPEVKERIEAILATSSIASWWDDETYEEQVAA